MFVLIQKKESRGTFSFLRARLWAAGTTLLCLVAAFAILYSSDEPSDADAIKVLNEERRKDFLSDVAARKQIDAYWKLLDQKTRELDKHDREAKRDPQGHDFSSKEQTSRKDEEGEKETAAHRNTQSELNTRHDSMGSRASNVRKAAAASKLLPLCAHCRSSMLPFCDHCSWKTMNWPVWNHRVDKALEVAETIAAGTHFNDTLHMPTDANRHLAEKKAQEAIENLKAAISQERQDALSRPHTGPDDEQAHAQTQCLSFCFIEAKSLYESLRLIPARQPSEPAHLSLRNPRHMESKIIRREAHVAQEALAEDLPHAAEQLDRAVLGSANYENLTPQQQALIEEAALQLAVKRIEKLDTLRPVVEAAEKAAATVLSQMRDTRDDADPAIATTAFSGSLKAADLRTDEQGDTEDAAKIAAHPEGVFIDPELSVGIPPTLLRTDEERDTEEAVKTAAQHPNGPFAEPNVGVPPLLSSAVQSLQADVDQDRALLAVGTSAAPADLLLPAGPSPDDSTPASDDAIRAAAASVAAELGGDGRDDTAAAAAAAAATGRENGVDLDTAVEPGGGGGGDRQRGTADEALEEAEAVQEEVLRDEARLAKVPRLKGLPSSTVPGLNSIPSSTGDFSPAPAGEATTASAAAAADLSPTPAAAAVMAAAPASMVEEEAPAAEADAAAAAGRGLDEGSSGAGSRLREGRGGWPAPADHAGEAFEVDPTLTAPRAAGDSDMDLELPVGLDRRRKRSESAARGEWMLPQPVQPPLSAASAAAATAGYNGHSSRDNGPGARRPPVDSDESEDRDGSASAGAAAAAALGSRTAAAVKAALGGHVTATGDRRPSPDLNSVDSDALAVARLENLNPPQGEDSDRLPWTGARTVGPPRQGVMDSEGNLKRHVANDWSATRDLGGGLRRHWHVDSDSLSRPGSRAEFKNALVPRRPAVSRTDDEAPAAAAAAAAAAADAERAAFTAAVDGGGRRSGEPIDRVAGPDSDPTSAYGAALRPQLEGVGTGRPE